MGWRGFHTIIRAILDADVLENAQPWVLVYHRFLQELHTGDHRASLESQDTLYQFFEARVGLLLDSGIRHYPTSWTNEYGYQAAPTQGYQAGQGYGYQAVPPQDHQPVPSQGFSGIPMSTWTRFIPLVRYENDIMRARMGVWDFDVERGDPLPQNTSESIKLIVDELRQRRFPREGTGTRWTPRYFRNSEDRKGCQLLHIEYCRMNLPQTLCASQKVHHSTTCKGTLMKVCPIKP